MKLWKTTLVSAAVAAMVLTGCGDKKSETTSHEAAPKAQVETHAAPAAKAPAPVEETKPQTAETPAAEQHPVKEAATAAAEEMAAPAKEEVQKEAERIAESVAQGEAEGKQMAEEKMAEAKKAIDVATLYTKCAGCHGLKGEKHALGQSNVIAGQSKEDLVKKLEGYKNGTYGGAMKGLMAGQVKNLTPEQIDALAEYISKL